MVDRVQLQLDRGTHAQHTHTHTHMHNTQHTLTYTHTETSLLLAVGRLLNGFKCVFYNNLHNLMIASSAERDRQTDGQSGMCESERHRVKDVERDNSLPHNHI